MSVKVLVFSLLATLASAGYLEPVPAALRVSVHAPQPLISLVSPAVTKTHYVPGSYSSSYRTDVITPRVKYTETPGVSITVPQPTIAIAPAVTRVEHVAPVAPFTPTVERIERIEEIAHTPVIPAITRVETPALLPVPALSSAVRIEHLAPAPLLPAPALPAVARVQTLGAAPLLSASVVAPAIERIAPVLPEISRVQHIASAPLVSVPALPAVSRVEHLAPASLLAAPAITKSIAFNTAPVVRSEFASLPLAHGLDLPAHFARNIDFAHHL